MYIKGFLWCMHGHAYHEVQGEHIPLSIDVFNNDCYAYGS